MTINFCRTSLISENDTDIFGAPGDCIILIVVSLGLMWVIISNSKHLKNNNYYNNYPTLSEPLNLIRDINNKILLEENYTDDNNDDKNSKKSLSLISFQLISILSIIISLVSLILGYLNDVETCNSISFYLTFIFRSIGWLIVFVILYNNEYLWIYSNEKKSRQNNRSQDRKITDKKSEFLYSCVGWCFSQVVSGGINSVHYGIDTSMMGYYITLIFYFLLTIISCLILSFSLLITDDLNHTDNSLLHASQQNSYNRSKGNSYRNNDTNNTVNQSISSMEESNINGVDGSVAIDVRSLWRGGKNIIDVSVDSNSLDMRLSFDSIQSEEEIGQTTDNGEISSMKEGSLDEKNRYASSNLFSSSPGPVIHRGSGTSSSKVAGKLREQVLSLSGDVCISVVDYEKISINGKTFLIYKLVLGESATSKALETESPSPRTVRIVRKRHDEIVYLREKISTEFSHIHLPEVPTPPIELIADNIGSTTNTNSYGNINLSIDTSCSDAYDGDNANPLHKDRNSSDSNRKSVDVIDSASDRHRKDMSDFLETLITNPMIGRVVIHDIRSTQDDLFLTERDNKKSYVNEEEKKIEDIHISNANESIHILFPFILWNDPRLLAISVTGWSEIGAIKKELKVFYSIEVKFKEFVWTLSKRYRQFRSLYNSIKEGCDIKVEFPVKVNKKKTKSKDRETETKYNENTLRLNSFLKELIKEVGMAHPLLLIFLESDICNRTSGYDVIKITNNLWSLEKTTLSSLNDRKIKGDQIEKSLQDMSLISLNINKYETTSTVILGSSFASIAETDDDGYSMNDEDRGSGKKLNSSAESSSNPSGSILSILSFQGKKRPVDYYLKLPGVILNDLISLMRFLKVNSLSKHNRSSKGVVSGSGLDSQYHYEFVPQRHRMLLDSKYKLLKEDDSGLNSSTFDDINDISQQGGGVWVNQYRMKAILLCTTAFVDILNSTVLLKEMSFKDIKDNVSEKDKYTFLINIYNLMSLIGSILCPWPAIDDKKGRILWQKTVRFNIGNNSLNLLQLEHAIIRIKTSVLDFPTFPGSDIPIPNSADFKYYANIFPSIAEPRVSFTLALPFKTSPLIHTYKRDALKKQIRLATSEYLVSRVTTTKQSIILPKILRKYENDFYGWRDENVGMNSLEDEGDEDEIIRNSSPIMFVKESSRSNPSNNRDRDSRDNNNSLISRGDISESSPSNTAGSYNSQRSPNRNSSNSLSRRMLSGSAGSSSIVEWDLAGKTSSNIDNKEKNIIPEKIAKLSSTTTPLGDLLANHCFEFGNNLLSTEFKLAEFSNNKVNRIKEKNNNNNNNNNGGIKLWSGTGDFSISENEIFRLKTLIQIGIECLDRTYRMRTYKQCFLGTDLVRCFLASGDAKNVDQAIALGDLLIEHRYIQHAVKQHWMRDLDLFYCHTDYSLSKPQITPYYAFLAIYFADPSINDIDINGNITTNTDSNEINTTRGQKLLDAVDGKHNVSYLPEDYSFSFPLV